MNRHKPWRCRTRIPRRALYGFLLVSVISYGSTGALGQEPQHEHEIFRLSLEQLMDTEVTSVSKKEERLFDAPAAIYVITQEDIRRSGATSIPEALRMVPGVEVARISSNTWAISARGFNDQFANKLLVLIDGRSVYTPLFAGVLWDVQDTLLEDVERIEVIRGPGGTLWGANAVNGVINIITRSAKDTHGGLVTGGGGKQERGFVGARYGADLGHGLHGRLYAKYFDRDEFVDQSGHGAGDQWDSVRGGFRFDWDAGVRDALTFQGDLYQGNAGTTTTRLSLLPPFGQQVRDTQDLSGGNLLARWSHVGAAGSNSTLQLYYDRTGRAVGLLREDRDTFDLDFQHRLRLGQRHEVTAGLGYRLSADQIRDSFDVIADPRRRSLNLFSAFLQDQITLFESLQLTLGTKLEHNDFTGIEVQPSGRLLWRPLARHSVWAAVSRAVRTPSRGETAFRYNAAVIPDPALTVVSVIPNPRFAAEELLAYELGYRLQPAPGVFVDFATSYATYDHLLTNEQDPTKAFPESIPSPAHMVVPVYVANNADGDSYAAELAAYWDVTTYWKLAAGYSWLTIHVHPNRSSTDTSVKPQTEGSSPHNQFHLRSYLDLPGSVELDAALYYVDNVPARGIGSYIRGDLRLGWQPTEQLELSVVAQNIAEEQHAEFANSFSTGVPPPAEIPRAIFGQLRLRL